MTIYQPYFYIIQDIHNGMYYAGAKWGKDANPNLFMKMGGYTTSSKLVNFKISHDGIDSFMIRKIKIFENKSDTRNYETIFLKKVKAKTNPMFYNKHENDGYMDSDKQRDFFRLFYGVNSPFESSEIRYKAKTTLMKNYGVDTPMKSDVIRKRFISTNNLRYGTDYPIQNREVKQRQIKTNNERYGVDNVFQSEEVKSKMKITNSEKYGFEFAQQSDEIKSKISNTNLLRYDAKHPMQSNEVKQRQIKTNNERYGVDYVFQSEDFKRTQMERKKQKANRGCVKQYNSLCEMYSIKRGSGFYLKSDEEILKRIEEIEKQHI